MNIRDVVVVLELNHSERIVPLVGLDSYSRVHEVSFVHVEQECESDWLTLERKKVILWKRKYAGQAQEVKWQQRESIGRCFGAVLKQDYPAHQQNQHDLR